MAVFDETVAEATQIQFVCSVHIFVYRQGGSLADAEGVWKLEICRRLAVGRQSGGGNEIVSPLGYAVTVNSRGKAGFEPAKRAVTTQYRKGPDSVCPTFTQTVPPGKVWCHRPRSNGVVWSCPKMTSHGRKRSMAAGEKFRRDVRNSYDFRCLFTGQRLPKTDVTESAGVDAAHILPWSTHNINAIPNGICLSKLCHWAFDAGVVKLSYNTGESAYVLEVPTSVRSAATKAGFDLASFDAVAGKIPASRLPKNPKLWPSPKYLDELNKFTFASVV